jgi:hypothetical protein
LLDAAFAEGGESFLAGVFVHIEKHDCSFILGKALSDGPADSTASSGND